MRSASTPEQAVESLSSLVSGLSASGLAGEDLRREVVRSLESILSELRGGPNGRPVEPAGPDPDDDDDEFWIAM